MKRRLTLRLLLLALATLTTVAAAWADEGMWTFQRFPSDTVRKLYGAEITPAWLTNVRTSVVRLSNCTASFVSPDGLILTNHHCAEACLAEHSSKTQSLMEEGFLADQRSKELRCGTQVADVLMEMEDVTSKVLAATRGLADKAANDMRKKTLTQLEQSCEEQSARDTKTGPLKCESVDLYNGGQYYLYKYRRYDDVRLVFAPEQDIAAFGGDPDNFQFPRWDLDMSVLRAYESGKPAHTPTHLSFDFAGPAAEQLVFVAGHPGSTDRLLTVSQLLTQRDVDLPTWLLRAAELRGRYIEFGKSSPEANRIVQEPLNSLENSIKVRRKLLDALHDDRQLARKAREETDLKKRVAADPQLARTVGDPWGDIERAQRIQREIALPYTFIEAGAGFNSRLFRYARVLVRAAAERAKPNQDRLREYTDAALPRLKQQIAANVPVYPELEVLTMSFGLERMREWLGPDQPLVRRILSHDSPDSLATRLVKESKLGDAAVRLKLWDGGAQAINASHDPMIEFARLVDPDARAIRHRQEDEVEAPVQAASERIARARFALLGTSVYPDANFTLRLNFGRVRGWTENGKPVDPFTQLQGLFDRATGAVPFRIPQSWLAVKDRLDMHTRFNLASDNDIVGGNSGSPLIDAKGHIVGLIFDGNIHSIAGTYWFDPEMNRAVAVHPAIILEALRKVYHADAMLKELGAP
jgi:hypothetical protein